MIIVTQSHPYDLEKYFKSIEVSFLETLEYEQRKKKTDVVEGIAVFLFVFSLIPLAPYFLSLIVHRLTTSTFFTLWGFQFPIGSFWFLWVTTSVLTLALMIIAFKVGKLSKEAQARQLSPAQMRFEHCYGILDEIKNYQTNRLSPHIENAERNLECLRELLIPLYAGLLWRARGTSSHELDFRLRLVEDQMGPKGFPVRFPFSMARWFKLEPKTEEIIRALLGLKNKLKYRIRDKKDLSLVMSALSCLAQYLYSEIPEMGDSTKDERSKLDEWGDTALYSFAKVANDLPVYRSELKKTSSHENISQRVALTGWKLSNLFSHPNVLICFLVWYVLFFIIISSGFKIAFSYNNDIQMDTIIISTLVGGPVGAAITAVTVARIGSSSKNQSRNSEKSDD